MFQVPSGNYFFYEIFTHNHHNMMIGGLDYGIETACPSFDFKFKIANFIYNYNPGIMII